jgi:hypothetical protein
MGQRPAHRNESQDVTPAKAGVHVREELDSRFRGNDVTFDGAKRRIPAFEGSISAKKCRDSSPAGRDQNDRQWVILYE